MKRAVSNLKLFVGKFAMAKKDKIIAFLKEHIARELSLIIIIVKISPAISRFMRDFSIFKESS